MEPDFALSKNIKQLELNVLKFVFFDDFASYCSVFPNFPGSGPACQYRGRLGNHWIKLNILY